MAKDLEHVGPDADYLLRGLSGEQQLPALPLCWGFIS